MARWKGAGIVKWQYDYVTYLFWKLESGFNTFPIPVALAVKLIGLGALLVLLIIGLGASSK